MKQCFNYDSIEYVYLDEKKKKSVFQVITFTRGDNNKYRGKAHRALFLFVSRWTNLSSFTVIAVTLLPDSKD